MASMEDYPPLEAAKARCKKTITGQEKRPAKASSKSRTKSRTKFRPVQDEDEKDQFQTAHPCLEYQEDASTTISDIGPQIVREMMSVIGNQSIDSAFQLTRSCQVMWTLGTSINNIWERANETKFKGFKPLVGVSPYRSYQFLCKYKIYEGKFIINSCANRTYRNSPRLIRLSLFEIELTTTGLVVSTWWIPPGEVNLVKEAPFLELRVIESNSASGLLNFRPCPKTQSSLQLLKHPGKGDVNDWLVEGGTMEGWLLSAVGRDSFFDQIECLTWNRYLNRVQCQYKPTIHPGFMMPDGSLPSSMPLPGLFQDDRTGFRVLVRYSGWKLIITRLVDPQHYFFGENITANLKSAMVMSVAEQDQLDITQYLNFNKGLRNHPSNYQDPCVFNAPAEYNFPQQFARAWYTSIPPYDDDFNWPWKVVVQNHTWFVLMRPDSIWQFWRRNDVN